MTTQELKQYIDKVLGNSIRCLLPSYWWKRLFSLLADRVDDKQDILVSGKNIKTINGNSLLGEGDTNVDIIINSVDELNTLDLPTGSRASVVTGGPVLSSIKDCVESNDETQWTRVSGVQINAFPDFSLFSADANEASISFFEGTSPSIYIVARKDELVMGAVRMNTSETIYLSRNGVDISQDAVDRLNGWLKTGDYKVAVYNGLHDMSDFFDSFIKFYIYHPTVSDVYVKADSWEKLSKEYVVSSEEELNALSVENGAIAKVVREIRPQAVKVSDCYLTNNIDNYASEWDKFTVIKKIEETDVNAESSNILYICALNESFTKDAIGVGYDNGVRCYIRIVDGVESPVSLDIVNNLLVTGNYRLVIRAIAGRFDSYFTFYTEVAKDVSDAYIKGETWTRLLKEGDNPIIVLDNGTTQKNADAFKKILHAYENDLGVLVLYKEDAVGAIVKQFYTTRRISYANDKIYLNLTKDNDSSDKIYQYKLTADGKLSYNSSWNETTIDEALSDTSTNAVQNKVITAALGNKVDKTYVDNAIANAITTTLNTAV